MHMVAWMAERPSSVSRGWPRHPRCIKVRDHEPNHPCPRRVRITQRVWFPLAPQPRARDRAQRVHRRAGDALAGLREKRGSSGGHAAAASGTRSPERSRSRCR